MGWGSQRDETCRQKKTKREKEKGERREEGREREYKGLKRMTLKAALDPTTDRKGNKGTTNQKKRTGSGRYRYRYSREDTVQDTRWGGREEGFTHITIEIQIRQLISFFFLSIRVSE